MTALLDRTPDRTLEPPDVSGTVARSKHGGRIVGIDIARGIALLGMFTVHVFIGNPDGEPSGAFLDTVLNAPSGRASVLFFILSGISLSIITRAGSASAEPAVLRRRGVILLLAGLLLAVGPWGGSILQHYGVMFLVAPVLLRSRTRTLGLLAAFGMIVGPVIALVTLRWSDRITDFSSEGALGWLIENVWSLGVTGIYPLVIWAGFFTLGVALGRLDLRSIRVGALLLATGVAGVVVVTTGSAFLAGDGLDLASKPAVDDAFDFSSIDDEEFERMAEAGSLDNNLFSEPTDFGQLIVTDGHSGQIGWTLQASSIAIAILGATLLLPAAGTRFLRPLSMLGSISLTAYLGHIFLVTDVWNVVVGETPTMSANAQFGVLIALEALMVISAVVIVRVWKTGPAEKALKALTSR